ncbi:glycosyltransferase family 39 protein [Candidatus Gottesmanbacteria bacterium]|nr:glycosyltransferase family 39 protein [Candidatus Gottesmanbacteria bacterium]
MIVLLIFIGFILRIININQSLWLDEAAQVIESSLPFEAQFNIPADFQPPLFHLLLHLWIKLGGTSEAWMRLLPIGLSVVSLIILYKIVNFIYGNRTALLTTTFMALNPFAVYYAQELRPYPLSLFTALVTIWGLVKKSRLITIIGITSLLYATYFAPFFIVSIFIYILLTNRKDVVWFAKNTIISIIIFLPWIPSFLTQFKNGTDLITKLPGWSEAVSTPIVKAIPLVFAKFFLGRISIDQKIIYGGVILLLTTIFIYFTYKLSKDKKNYLPLVLFWSTLLVSWLTSFFVPIIDPKRLLFMVPFFCLILGLGVLKESVAKKIFLSIIIIIPFIYGLTIYYTNERFQREQWKQAVRFVESNGDGTQVVIFAFPAPFAPYQWYSQNLITTLAVAPDFIVNQNNLDNMTKLLEGRKTVYLFQYLTGLTDPAGSIQKTLELNGYINNKTFDFPGVGFVYQYDKTALAVAP